MAGCAVLTGKLSATGVLQGAVSAEASLAGALTIAGSVPSYHGSCEITPGDVPQIVECSGLLMPQNIVVNPVPSNYGRIDWDGISLSVY